MRDVDELVPIGLCQCGCGAPTSIATSNCRRNGWVKGQPKRFVMGHARRKSGVEYVEEDRGFETPCWIWQRGGGDGAYGRTFVGYRRGRQAHRVYYERVNGPIPEGLELHHRCWQPSCVNPDHLEPLTHAEHMRLDRRVKLTIEKAEEIRRSTLSCRKVAAQFGVSAMTVSNVRRGLMWADASPKTEVA